MNNSESHVIKGIPETFENTPELSGPNRAAIEAKERPVNVFDQNAKEKDPIPVVDGMAIEEA